MQRIALLLEYNGGVFHGSQMQPGHRTVQGELVQALRRLNVQPQSVMMAGRTDAGVHAKGQVAHFDVAPDALKNIDNLQISLNALLPDAIRVRDCRLDVPRDFHSMACAEYKWYRYKIYYAPHSSVWMPPDALWLRPSPDSPLHLERMQEAARLILGKHHFKSFQCPDTNITDDVCDMIHAEFHQETAKNGEFPGILINFDIVGNRFLYKMVRNLMGQLLFIGQAGADKNPEAQDPQSILTVLNQLDRTAAAGAAKANGLSLMAVHYPPQFRCFAQDPLVQRLDQLIQKIQSNSTQTESSQHEQDLFRKAS